MGVAYGWWLPFETTLRGNVWPDARHDSTDGLVTTRRTDAEERFSDFVKRFETPDIVIEGHFLSGDPRAVLPKLCREAGYDLVVPAIPNFPAMSSARPRRRSWAKSQPRY